MLTNTYLDRVNIKVKYQIEQGDYLATYYKDNSAGKQVWRFTLFKNKKSIINETIIFSLSKEEVKEKMDYHIRLLERANNKAV